MFQKTLAKSRSRAGHVSWLTLIGWLRDVLFARVFSRAPSFWPPRSWRQGWQLLNFARFCRTAFDLDNDTTKTSAKRNDSKAPKTDTKQKPPPRSLSPIKQEPSTSTKTSAAPQATQSEDSSQTKPRRVGSPIPQGHDKKGKSAPFLTRAFFNTVAPGLASFAQTQKSELDIVVEEDEEIEEDPDVIAMMADF